MAARHVGLARLAALQRSGAITPQQGEVFELRDDCQSVLSLWGHSQTQWRVGMSGPTGLDYAGVRASPAFRRLPRDEREDAFEGVCVMERAYLGRLAELAKEKQSGG